MSKEDAKFWHDLREKLKAGVNPSGSIFTPPAPRDCTAAAPFTGARWHAAAVEVRTITRADGEHTVYRCEDCGAEWEV